MIRTVCTVCFETVARVLDDVSNNPLKIEVVTSFFTQRRARNSSDTRVTGDQAQWITERREKRGERPSRPFSTSPPSKFLYAQILIERERERDIWVQGRHGIEPKYVSSRSPRIQQSFLGWIPGTRQSAIYQLFSLSLVTLSQKSLWK